MEPEAANIYCQYLPIEKLQGVGHGFSISEEGTKFMIEDIGGKDYLLVTRLKMIMVGTQSPMIMVGTQSGDKISTRGRLS